MVPIAAHVNAAFSLNLPLRNAPENQTLGKDVKSHHHLHAMHIHAAIMYSKMGSIDACNF
jgi:hypothetical protein